MEKACSMQEMHTKFWLENFMETDLQRCRHRLEDVIKTEKQMVKV
jgi:hypothetical protein